MIETETEWEDSGYDCNHCGGQIFKRTDRETGQPIRICYQCQACGCQWKMGGAVLRIGHKPACKVAQRTRLTEPEPESTLPTTLIFTLVLLAILILTPFRGLLTLHWVIPVTIGAFVVLSLVRLGRERQWW